MKLTEPLIIDDETGRTEHRTKKLKEALMMRQPTLTVVLENVHDPHNVSAVIRSCDAVGIPEAHWVYYGGQKFPRLGEKSSASARKWVKTHFYDNIEKCYAAIRAEGKRIYTTNMSRNAVSVYDLDMTQPLALVFGNEHKGVSDLASELADGNFLVPQAGVIQSLNISVACAVSLYEAFRQRKAAGMYFEIQFTEEQFDKLLREWMRR